MNKRKLIAFEMEFCGSVREKIAKKTSYKTATLNAYFAKNGLWHKEYREWVGEKLGKINLQIEDLLVSSAIEATQTIIRIMKSEDPLLMLRAAGMILDRAGFGKKREVLDTSTKADDIAEQMTKFYEQKRLRNSATN